MDPAGEVAAGILESRDVSSMAKYSQEDIKRRGKWEELFCNRGALADMLRATRWGTLHHMDLTRQTCSFKQACNIAGCKTYCEVLVYRLSVMIVHGVNLQLRSRC